MSNRRTEEMLRQAMRATEGDEPLRLALRIALGIDTKCDDGDREDEEVFHHDRWEQIYELMKTYVRGGEADDDVPIMMTRLAIAIIDVIPQAHRKKHKELFGSR